MASVLLSVALAGCGTPVLQPHKLVLKLDPASPRYGTEECRQARLLALNYDDNAAGRGLGWGLALLLGPIALPIAFAADFSQDDKRTAVVKELQRTCMTQQEIDALKPPEPAGGRPSGPPSSGSSQGSQMP